MSGSYSRSRPERGHHGKHHKHHKHGKHHKHHKNHKREGEAAVEEGQRMQPHERGQSGGKEEETSNRELSVFSHRHRPRTKHRTRPKIIPPSKKAREVREMEKAVLREEERQWFKRERERRMRHAGDEPFRKFSSAVVSQFGSGRVSLGFGTVSSRGEEGCPIDYGWRRKSLRRALFFAAAELNISMVDWWPCDLDGKPDLSGNKSERQSERRRSPRPASLARNSTQEWRAGDQEDDDGDDDGDSEGTNFTTSATTLIDYPYLSEAAFVLQEARFFLHPEDARPNDPPPNSSQLGFDNWNGSSALLLIFSMMAIAWFLWYVARVTNADHYQYTNPPPQASGCLHCPLLTEKAKAKGDEYSDRDSICSGLDASTYYNNHTQSDGLDRALLRCDDEGSDLAAAAAGGSEEGKGQGNREVDNSAYECI